LKASYFTVENGIFNSGNIPDPSQSQSAPVISSVYGNRSILEGGSNPISIQTSSSVKEVIIGVQDIQGYYVMPATTTQGSILIVLLFSQSLEKDSFVIVLALRDANGLVSDHVIIEVTKIEAGTGKLQVSCSWDRPNDVDLHLVEPKGEEICFDNDISANGGKLDVDSNPDCVLDNINSENITYDSNAIIESGTYIVKVALYSDCYVTSNTNFVVSTLYNGKLITPALGSNPCNGVFHPEDVDRGGTGHGRQIMTFSVSPSKSETPKEKRIKFVYPKPIREKESKGGSKF
jgi:DNA/RNA endonuclease YhcR with UshA esterase domain